MRVLERERSLRSPRMRDLEWRSFPWVRDLFEMQDFSRNESLWASIAEMRKSSKEI